MITIMLQQIKADTKAIRLNLSLRIRITKIAAIKKVRKAEKIISKDLFSTSKFNLAARANQKVACRRRKYRLKVREPAAKEIAKNG